MASSIKSKISQATSSSKATSDEQEKYRLLVTAGPSYNLSTHKTVKVNTEEATYIENKFLRAKIQVRIRGYRGLPSSSPSESTYFNDQIHKNDQYSVGFSFVPKIDIPSKDTVWGNDLDHPIRDRLPPGFNTAFRIVKEFIDPGLSCDVYADEPWLYGPSTSCWFALRIGEKLSNPEKDDFPPPGILLEGADGSGQEIRSSLNIPENSEKRRKHFLSSKNREEFVFEKGRVYMADFYNPYLDFANYALKLPGFSLKVIRYIGDKTHCLRYVFKESDGEDVFLNVNITLLWGEKLQQALREDEQASGGAKEKELVGVVAGREVGNGRVNGGEEEGQQAREGTGEQVHGGEDEEAYESAEEDAEDGSTSAPPPEMQLHPGDHTATAEHTAAKVKEDPIDEIDRLLRETSTKQKRET